MASVVTLPRMQTSVSSVTLDKPKLKDSLKTLRLQRSKDMERKGNVGFLGGAGGSVFPGPGLVMTHAE